MADINRVTPFGWVQETGTINRVTPSGWLQETTSAAPAAHVGSLAPKSILTKSAVLKGLTDD